MKKTLIVQAPAKINIGLWVKNRRPDGFHELESIMQTVSLSDYIVLKQSKEPGIRVTCSNLAVPEGSENIAFKAARIFHERLGIEPALDISIDKKIPMAAGLAGGSTDAAAVLTALPKLFERSVSNADLMDMAAALGSDIPFVLKGGLAHTAGRGEKLTFLAEPKVDYTIVIVVPNDVGVSTKWCYENYIPGNNEAKERSFAMIADAYINGDLTTLRKVIFNDLESVTLQRYPIVQRIKELLSSAGDGAVLMSGSGPSVFGIFANRVRACMALKALDGMPVDVFIEHTSKRKF